MYDVVVVGAGPSGSRFARSAAERGRSVLVLESGEIGRPLACSGHVSLDVWDFVPDSARRELLENEIYGARFHLGGADSPAHRFHKGTVVSNASTGSVSTDARRLRPRGGRRDPDGTRGDGRRGVPGSGRDHR